MKFLKVASYGLLAVALSTVSTRSAFANIILNFDENGNGTWGDSAEGGATQNGYTGSSGNLTSVLASDPYCVSHPTTCVGGTVLIYDLPEFVNAGAVAIGEPGDTVNTLDALPSDVLFFTNSDGVSTGQGVANLMVYYSADIGGGALADTGLPTGSFTDITDETLGETFQWLPDQLTFANGGNEYDGISGAPEPASLSLIGIGMLGLGLMARKRRSA